MNKKRRALKRRLLMGRLRSGMVPIERCGLYGLSSLTPLSKLLFQTNSVVREIAKSPRYAQWTERKVGKKPRLIQDPRGATESIHYRLFELLDRVERPDFLHSATRRRSIVSNAKAHVGLVPVCTTDMKNCFDATTVFKVYGFFKIDLNIKDDIAWKLARICCVDGHLPTGSCLSPLLAYWAHRSVFNRIDSLCKSVGVVMTIYVDDLTFSGKHATKALLYKIKSILSDAGLLTHKDVIYHSGGFKRVTGVMVSRRGIHVPNRRLFEVVKLTESLKSCEEAEKARLNSRISGLLGYVSSISPSMSKKLKMLRSRKLGAKS